MGYHYSALPKDLNLRFATIDSIYLIGIIPERKLDVKFIFLDTD